MRRGRDNGVSVGAGLRGRAPGRLGLRGLVGILVIGLVIALAISQLVLPRVAAKVLRDRVAKYGQVQSASVSAFPAIKLLWGSADSAKLTASRLAISPHQLIALLEEAKPVTDLTVRASGVDLLDPGFGAGAVSLSDSLLQKRGQIIHMSVLLSSAALQRALPPGVSVSILAGAGGSVQVRASGQLFGFTAGVEATVIATEGKLELRPTQPLWARLARLTLFSDPRLEVLGVSADAAQGQGQSQSAWLLHLSARLR